jgi:hypothetical protein
MLDTYMIKLGMSCHRQQRSIMNCTKYVSSVSDVTHDDIPIAFSSPINGNSVSGKFQSINYFPIKLLTEVAISSINMASLLVDYCVVELSLYPSNRYIYLACFGCTLFGT